MSDEISSMIGKKTVYPPVPYLYATTAGISVVLGNDEDIEWLYDYSTGMPKVVGYIITNKRDNCEEISNHN